MLLPLATLWQPFPDAGVQVAAHRDAPLSPDSALGKAVLGGYVLSVIWAAARLLHSWYGTRRIVRGAQPRRLPHSLQEALARVQSRLGTGPLCVLFSGQPLSPMTLGALRPVIIVPPPLFESESEDLLLSVLGHEAAHIRRKDFLWNALCEVLYVAVAFHPCAALVRRRIRESRELACDGIVATHLLDGSRYAASLLDFALQALPACAAHSLGAFGSHDLEERIRRLVHRPVRDHDTRPVLALALCAVLLGTCLAAAFALGFRTTDPRLFAGVWQRNWAANSFRAGIRVGPGCCLNMLELKYQNDRLSGFFRADRLRIVNNEAVRTGWEWSAVREPVIENGKLKLRSDALMFELMPAGNGHMRVRVEPVPRVYNIWTDYTRRK